MGKIYKYSELRNVIRVGDIVRAVPGKQNNCTNELKNDGSNTVKITKIADEYFWIGSCSHGFFTDNAYLEIVSSSPRTIKDADVGDVVKNKAGYFRKILDKGTANNVLHLSELFMIGENSDNEKKFCSSIDREFLEEYFTLVLPPEEKPVREVTMSEIIEKFGEEVKIKREE